MTRPNVATVLERVTGHRRVAGTDWPIVDRVERQEYSGRVEWVLVSALCNGTSDGSRAYTTRRAALEAFGTLAPVQS